VDTPFFNNIFYPYEIQWLTLVSGVTGNDKLFEDTSFWREKFLEHYRSHRPFKALDQTVGNPSPDFQTWLQHPTPDDYWDQMALTPEAYDRINIPILSLTSHYDTDQPGALHYYRAHMQSASPARDRHYLIIGPWDHAGSSEFGGLKFGQASELDVNELHKAWYDWTLKDGPRPEFLKQRVAYYVAGAEEWKYADDLEGISNADLRLYLNSANGQANDVFHSGTLDEAPPGVAQPDRYVYDPLDVRFGELERGDIDAYLTDQRYALNLFGNGLVYHSTPFAEEVEISGCVKLVAWIAIDVPDTDFQATLSEVRFDGSHIRLAQDMLRARYRESLRQEKLVIPGQINCYTFTGFTFFARRIAKGSRLRLVISCPNSIYLEKNYNSGGVVVEESGEDARTAHVTLYHDAEHASYVDLPLVKQP
jgi:putative CocE/NonD family hydrolase